MLKLDADGRSGIVGSRTTLATRMGALAVFAALVAWATGLAPASAQNVGERPTISGDPVVGATLTSSLAGDTGLYRWQVCDPAIADCSDGPFPDGDWQDIDGAQGHDQRQYAIPGTDLGLFLRVLTKGTSLGEQWVPSEPVGPVTAGPVVVRPTITGEAKVGSTLTASSVGQGGLYRWQRCNPGSADCSDGPFPDADWQDIDGAEGPDKRQYTIPSTDVGVFLRVLTKGTSLGEQFVPSEPVGPIAGPGLAPNHGVDVIGAPVQGTVKVKKPGGGFAELSATDEIPIGSLIDTRFGTIQIVAATGHFDNDAPDEPMSYSQGVFQINQGAASDAFAVAKLAQELNCGNKKKKRKRARAGTDGPLAITSGRRKRRLWGRGRGRYRTRGRGGTGSVVGTTWITKDTCKGTVFKVTEGIGIVVRDFARKKNVKLGPGQQYFAKVGKGKKNKKGKKKRKRGRR